MSECDIYRLQLCDELNGKVSFYLRTSKDLRDSDEKLYREDGDYTYSYGSAQWVYFNCLIGEVEGVSDEDIIKMSGVYEHNIARQYMGGERYKAAGGK